MRLSLRAKGFVALCLLTVYVVLAGGVLSNERQKLLSLALALEQVYEKDSDISRTEYSIHHSLLRLQSVLFSDRLTPSVADDMALDVELVQSGLQKLHGSFPQLGGDIATLGVRIAAVRNALSQSSLVDLQSALGDLESRIAAVDQQLRLQHQATWASYYRVYEGMTLIAVSTLLLGILLFGGVVTLFFSRLAWDIGKLEERAGRVVAGFRGDPLPVTRQDEVGRLMGAVNRMQTELRRHEQQLEIVRQQRFHHEKMAAVGSLAAAVAHEINNPIAAISGIARSIAASGRCGGGTSDDFEGDGPQLILQQAERISAISRQIAEFTRPHSPLPELIDLNRLVRSVCKFTGYDGRLRDVELALDLDPGLPAVHCVADHVTQVLMNLLINAGDAVRGVTGRRPSIIVNTRLDPSQACIIVTDKVHGMDEAVRKRAFEEGFTTKERDRGLGLGLFLCKALVEGDGGRIALDSRPGEGTTVLIGLPLHPVRPD